MQQQAQQVYQQQATVMPFATVWQRFLAILIDGGVLWLIGYVIGLITGISFSFNMLSFNMFSSVAIAQEPIALDLMLLPTIYFIVMEGALGYSIGKFVMGLRVVNVNTGMPITWWQAIIRNLLRIIDSIGGYFVGAICIWSSRRNQRIGDMFAKTAIIHTNKGLNIPF